MNEKHFNLFKDISLAFSVITQEDDRIKVIKSYLDSIGVENNEDSFGNLAAGNTSSPKVLIASHVDEIGVLITKARNDGLLEFTTAGYIHPHTLLNSVIQIKTDQGFVEGYIFSDKMFAGGMSGYELKTSDLLIDVGAKNFNQLTQLGVKVGQAGTYKKTFKQYDDRVFSTGVDNSVGCLINLMLAEDPEILENSCFVFHRGEECGSFGAKFVVNNIQAPYSVVLDYAPARVTNKGFDDTYPLVDKGPAVLYKAFEYTLNSDVEDLVRVTDMTVPSQRVFMHKPSEVGHFEINGSKGINLCVPARGFHSACYVVSIDDINKTFDYAKELVSNMCKNLNEVWYKYKYGVSKLP